jgi:ubiquinone/menaquinone biosynthesis C-methylase UbiE
MKLFGWKGEFTAASVRAHWNQVAATYDGWNQKYSSAHFQRFHEAMRHICLEPGMQILDIWSRTGNGSKFLLEACPQIAYLGIEAAENLARIAHQKYPQRTFLNADLTDLPLARNSFDRILSLETLEHVPQPQEFLAELRRVIRTGGLLVLSHPPSTAEWMTSTVDMLKMNHGEGPRRFLPSKETKSLLAVAGFRVMLHRGTVLLPFAPAFIRRWEENWLDERVQGTFLAELGIRQFYVCEAV